MFKEHTSGEKTSLKSFKLLEIEWITTRLSRTQNLLFSIFEEDMVMPIIFLSRLKYSGLFKIKIPQKKQTKKYFFRVPPNVLVLLTSNLSYGISSPSVIQTRNRKPRVSAGKSYLLPPDHSEHQALSVLPPLGSSLSLHLSLSRF